MSDLLELELNRAEDAYSVYFSSKEDVFKLPEPILKLNIRKRIILIFDIVESDDKEKIIIFYSDSVLEFYDHSKTNGNKYVLYFQFELRIIELISFSYTKRKLCLLTKKNFTNQYFKMSIFDYKSK